MRLQLDYFKIGFWDFIISTILIDCYMSHVKNFYFLICLYFFLIQDGSAQDYGGIAKGAAISFFAFIEISVVLLFIAFAVLSLIFYPRENFSLKRRLLIGFVLGLILPIAFICAYVFMNDESQKYQAAHRTEFCEITFHNSNENFEYKTRIRLKDHWLRKFSDESLRASDHAETIYINGGVSTFAPKIFEGFSKLKSLNIQSKEMKYIPVATLKNLNQLKSLNISYADLASIPDKSFCGLENLLNLNLTHNQTLEIQEHALVGLPNVESVELFGNNFVGVPLAALRELPRLRILGLSKNKFVSIPKHAFDGLKNLEFIDINQMHSLKNIEAGAFAGLPKLKQIDLSYTGIKKVSRSAIGAPAHCKIVGVEKVVN